MAGHETLDQPKIPNELTPSPKVARQGKCRRAAVHFEKDRWIRNRFYSTDYVY
jgi:hypothetical protein